MIRRYQAYAPYGHVARRSATARGPVPRPGTRPTRIVAGAAPAARASDLSLPWDPLRIALFLYILVVVSRFHAYAGLEAIRPALLLTAVAVGYAALKPSCLNLAALKETWPAKVMVAFMAVAFLSVPFSISTGGSGAFILESFSRMFVPLMLIVLAMRDSRDVRLFLWAYVVGCGLLAFISIFVVGLAKLESGVTWDPNDVGLIMVVGIPLTLAAFQTSGKTGKLLSLAILVGIGVTLALSESRGGFVGLLAVGAALLLFLKQIPVAKRVAFVVAIGLTLAVAAPAGYWDLMQTITSPTEDYNWESPYGRKALTERSIGYMLGNPLTGLGVGQTPRAEGQFAAPAQLFQETGEGRIKWSVAHNSFLEAGADLGIPGFILFASLIFGGIAAMMKLRRRLSWIWSRGDLEQRVIFYMTLYLPIAMIGFAVTGSFVSHTYSLFPYFLGALTVGVYASFEAQRRKALRQHGVQFPASSSRRVPPARRRPQTAAAFGRGRRPGPPVPPNLA